MFLLINMSEKDKIKLALFNEQDLYSTEFDGRNCG